MVWCRTERPVSFSQNMPVPIQAKKEQKNPCFKDDNFLINPVQNATDSILEHTDTVLVTELWTTLGPCQVEV